MVRWSVRPLDAALFLCIVFVLYLASSPASLSTFWPFRLLTGPKLQCSPEAYSSGSWVRKPGPITNMSRYEDVYALSGWTGCGSQHEHEWHFATTESNAWPWRSFASHFTYKPGPGCSSLRRFNQRELVQNLVERGGWLLIGDSLTEGHFFSISCMLHPHVRATPDYVVGTDYDRGWPQNLYLLPNSSFARTLRFPPGFSFEHTPLVTYRR